MTDEQTLDRALVERAMEAARTAARAAGDAALAARSGGLTIDSKSDGSPVTDADVAAEQAILTVIRREFPDHSILAEESGRVDEGSAFRWVIDPIDGTRGFARGGEFWGPLIALERNGRVVAGAMALPARGTTYWAGSGLGCWRDGAAVSITPLDDWSHATLSLGELSLLLAEPHGGGVRSLIDSAWSTRCFGDVGSLAMLLDGHADAWIEAGVQRWDLAPYEILVTEAGGHFSDFSGQRTGATRDAYACARGLEGRIGSALGA